MPGVGTFSWYIAIGEATGASADGRRQGEPVASNLSPSAGAMIKGITGAIQSFCHLDLDLLPLGSPIDLGMAERYVAGEEGTNRLVGLLKSFTELKGNMLTISVADVSTLREAQKHPEKYKDLRVRMGGWSAYFTMLSPEQQAHHIRKSEAGFF
jgi:formate C-acetyltransferase